MKLNYKRTIFVGMSFLSLCAFWQLYDQVVPLMLRNTFGLDDSATGMIMAADNVLALALLPLFGILSDRTRSRVGRRTPYIIVGTILAAGLCVALPYTVRPDSPRLFLTALALLVIAMGIYRVPAVALMPDVTPKPLRSPGNAVINVMGALGGMTALALIWLLAPQETGSGAGNEAVFLAVAALMLVSLAVLLATVRERGVVQEMVDIDYGMNRFTEDAAHADNMGRERLSPSQRKSLLMLLCSVALWFMGYNAVTSAFSRYAEEIWGKNLGASSLSLLVTNGGAILAFLPVGWLAVRFGRRTVICVGVVVVATSFALLGIFQEFSPALYILFAFAGIGWACINVNSYPMVVDLSRGASIGRYSGYYYVASMGAQIVTPILSGVLMKHVGYWVLFPYAAVMTSMALLTMTFVRHGESPMPDGEKPRPT